MIELTQTRLYPGGNCWQTAVACLLEIDPEVMPPQADYDWKVKKADGDTDWGPSYDNALQGYLHEHHDLTYHEMHGPPTLYPLLRIESPGWHLLTGRTVRSDQYGGMRHVVVARYGELAWDPHPSRAGLIEEIRWAFLVPYPDSWRKPNAVSECVCPKCKPGYRCRQPGEAKSP